MKERMGYGEFSQLLPGLRRQASRQALDEEDTVVSDWRSCLGQQRLGRTVMSRNYSALLFFLKKLQKVPGSKTVCLLCGLKQDS